jgi:hypothetical protein
MVGLGSAATMLVQGEDGMFSIFSLAHFLFGAVFNLVWIIAGVGEAWVASLVISTAAMLFEVAENSPYVGSVVWNMTLGFKSGREYRSDSLLNSQFDGICSNAGFFVIQLAEILSEGTAVARVSMAIGCGAVAIVFLVAFCAHRASLNRLLKRPERVEPPVLPIPAKGRSWFPLQI